MKLSVEILTHNWKIKLFSLFVASLLFFFVSYEGTRPDPRWAGPPALKNGTLLAPKSRHAQSGQN